MMKQKQKLLSHELRGYWKERAQELEAIHPLVGSWLLAAPVLLKLPPLKPVLKTLRIASAGGWRMKAVFDELGIPWNARRVKAQSVVLASHVDVFDAAFDDEICNSPEFMRANKDYFRMSLDGFGREGLLWGLRNPSFATNRLEVEDYFDEYGVKPNWSYNRVMKEHDKWVKELASEEAQAEARRPQNQSMVDYGSTPDEVVIDGVTVTALRKPADLILESARMQHCVGGTDYRSRLVGKRSQFFHLSDGENESTLEIINRDGKAAISQHKSERNKAPVAALNDAASAILGRVDLGAVSIQNSIHVAGARNRLTLLEIFGALAHSLPDSVRVDRNIRSDTVIIHCREANWSQSIPGRDIQPYGEEILRAFMDRRQHIIRERRYQEQLHSQLWLDQPGSLTRLVRQDGAASLQERRRTAEVILRETRVDDE